MKKLILLPIFLSTSILLAQSSLAQSPKNSYCDKFEIDLFLKDVGAEETIKLCGSLIPTDANSNAANKGGLCGQGWTLADRGIVREPPFILAQQETYKSTIPGTWTFNQRENVYSAKWKNGAIAKINLLAYGTGSTTNGFDIVLYRKDNAGVSNGLTACYTGHVKNGKITNGVVNWTFASGRKASGTWSASIQ